MSNVTQPFGGLNHDRLGGQNRHPEDAFVGQTMVASQDDAPDAPIEITAGQKMLSAISGSLFTSMLMTPLDVVRVRLQSQASPQPQACTADVQKLAVSTPNVFRPSNLGVTACCREVFFMNNNAEACIAANVGGSQVTSDCAVEHAQRRTFNSTFDGIRKIARNEGVTTLWRGLSPTVVMAVPANIIYFTGYEWLRYNKSSPINNISSDTTAPFYAGATARVVAASAINPIELFRTRLQASRGASATSAMAETVTGVKDMVAQHGYRSLWRGITLTLWRDVPFSGMYWFGYETIRGKLTDMREERRGRSILPEEGSKTRARSRSQSRENHTATFLDSFTAGATSGAFATIVTMPFDVGKTRTQSMLRLLRHIIATEGVSGLWKGWFPRVLKVAPSCAIMISSYEVGKRVFRGMNERKAKEQIGLETP
ncbi:mitochondrial carrier domain-containing protein [Apiospora kogelbergensis]|uniref:mitochondrial carrier domain-containing protein n=1 Tax=Apiospora kogelbergensis TaxID=1337665 RepID=UPI0031305F5D